nr:MAG TPA: hypothetical protein [Bacteriophage sp.]
MLNCGYKFKDVDMNNTFLGGGICGSSIDTILYDME